MEETIGKRIARLRQKSGWTQQSLSARLAISRVAMSQIEMDLIVPSERTITLLAGLFKLSPPALVEGTTYPPAKAERLPEVTCCFTALEHELALLENDLAWLERLAAQPDGDSARLRLADELRAKWAPKLDAWQEQAVDESEKALLREAQRRLNHVYYLHLP